MGNLNEQLESSCPFLVVQGARASKHFEEARVSQEAMVRLLASVKALATPIALAGIGRR